jgi:hypothetical protein
MTRPDYRNSPTLRNIEKMRKRERDIADVALVTTINGPLRLLWLEQQARRSGTPPPPDATPPNIASNRQSWKRFRAWVFGNLSGWRG